MSNRLMFRMTAPTAVISILLLAVGGVAARYVYRLQKHASEILTDNLAGVRAAEEFEIAVHEVRSRLKDFLYTGDRRHLEELPALRREAGRWLEEAERLATTPREQVLVARARRGYVRLFAEVDRLGRRPSGTPPGEKVGALIDDELTREVLGPIHEFLELNEDMAVRATARIQGAADRTVLILLLLGGCGAVAGLLAGYGIARGINRSIVQLSVPIRDAAGKLDGVVGPITVSAGHDLHDLEAALQNVAGQVGTVVERLHQSQREVLRSEQLAAVGQMAAGLAHELRNPLMAMKILVQPAARAGASVSLSGRDLAVLDEEITRLEHSLRTFLDFARPPQPEKRPFAVQGVLSQTVALVSGRAEQQGVGIECAVPEEPTVIEADVGQVRQVLLNLLLNALDATPEGGTVGVQVLRQEGGRGPNDRPGTGGWLTLRVADTGRGLPAELGDRIFEPFVSTKETGLGLGLSICKRIIEAHGGDITAADRPEGGAVFTIRLPLRATAAAPPGGSTTEVCHADLAGGG